MANEYAVNHRRTKY